MRIFTYLDSNAVTDRAPSITENGVHVAYVANSKSMDALTYLLGQGDQDLHVVYADDGAGKRQPILYDPGTHATFDIASFEDAEVLRLIANRSSVE